MPIIINNLSRKIAGIEGIVPRNFKYPPLISKSMEKVEKVVLGLAIFLLFTGFTSGLYLQNIEQENSKILQGAFIQVGESQLSIDSIFSDCPNITYSTDRGTYTGVLLSCIINFSGIIYPESHQYCIVGADGYTKTVSWSDMNRGILTDSMYTVFLDLPRAYWIHDVIKLEVK